MYPSASGRPLADELVGECECGDRADGALAKFKTPVAR